MQKHMIQLPMFMLFISSKTSSSQRVLGLPVGLLDMDFRLLIFCTILSSAMRSTWPNQFNLFFLINPIIFCPLNIPFIITFYYKLEMIVWLLFLSSLLLLKNLPTVILIRVFSWIFLSCCKTTANHFEITFFLRYHTSTLNFLFLFFFEKMWHSFPSACNWKIFWYNILV